MILLSKSKVVHNWQTSNWLPRGPALTWKGSGKPILDFSRLVARCACYKVRLVKQGAQLNKEHSCIMCKKCSAIDFTAGIEQKLSWTRREPMITVPTLLWNIFIMFWLQKYILDSPNCLFFLSWRRQGVFHTWYLSVGPVALLVYKEIKMNAFSSFFYTQCVISYVVCKFTLCQSSVEFYTLCCFVTRKLCRKIFRPQNILV